MPGENNSAARAARAARAVLGGAFDPPHAGHVCLARAALARLPVCAVLVVPNGDPRHRGVCAPWKDRVAMCELAFAGIAGVEVRRDEPPGAPRFSADTLRVLRRERPAAAIVFILGADAFAGLEAWREWRELFSLAHFAVAPRKNAPPPTPALADFCQGRFCENPGRLQSGAGLVLEWDVSCPDASSTALRQSLGLGRMALDVIPPSVLEYAHERKLYAA